MRGTRGRRLWRVVALVATAALALPAGAVGARQGTRFTPGSAGIGDSYFPLYGNGGYDVRHYGLHIRYSPRTDRLIGHARITAVAKKNLSRFNLDFVGLRVQSLTVDGRKARWVRRHQRELVVSPRHRPRKGSTFVVDARYAGVPSMFTVPGTPLKTGVVPTDDGAIIWGEPEVAAAWFPANDHPRDKASYRISLTVPTGLKAISNGRLVRRSFSRGWGTWTWRERAPMASYLAMAAIGKLDIRRRMTSEGLPILDAVDPDLGKWPRLSRHIDRSLAQEGRIAHFLERRFGAYPFTALGGVVDDKRIFAALENQTRPIYDYGFFSGRFGDFVIVHELAHQWYGDSVSVNEWKHIWLNEGFATYSEWLWGKKRGFFTPRQAYESYCSLPARNELWNVAPGDPGREHLFDGAVYVRGAMTLQALRRAVGGLDFFATLRAWTRSHRGRTGTTAQFVALAERVSHRRLTRLFKRWLYVPGKPAACSRSSSSAARGAGAAGTEPSLDIRQFFRELQTHRP